jgi:hypothetical protein
VRARVPNCSAFARDHLALFRSIAGRKLGI